jgi:hypothetical protein
MILSFTLLSLSSTFLLTFTHAQATYPPCALECISEANLGGCLLTDTRCLCEDQTFLQSSGACILALCTGSDLVQAEDVSKAGCLAVGVTLSIGSTPTATFVATSVVTSVVNGPAATNTSGDQSGNQSSNTQKKTSIIGPAVGGAVGGVVLIGLIVLGIILYTCKKRRQPVVRPTDEPKHHEPFDANATTQNLLQPGAQYGYVPTSYTPTSYTPSATPANDTYPLPHPGLPQGYTPVAEAMPAAAGQPRAHSYTPVAETMPIMTPIGDGDQSVMSNSQASTTPMLYMNNASTASTTPMLAYTNNTSTASSIRSYPAFEAQSTTTSTSRLSEKSPLFVSNPMTPPPPPEPTGMTDEQAKFIHELRNMNMPTAEITTVMENMRREEGGSKSGGPSTLEHSALVETGGPPRYDFKGPA